LYWQNFKNGNLITKKSGELRVLSIDGGGIKGIIPAIYLKRIEEHIGQPINKYFDLITGTSTGGIIALGISAGISAAEISELYIGNGEKIFPKKLFTIPFFSAKYSNVQLKKILQETFQDKKMEEAHTMLCIPSIEHHKAEPKVYKTPHHNDYIIDGIKPMWEVALATSAAPTYFPAAEIGDMEYKIDGGLWANNPILVALAEGKKIGFEPNQIKVLSLGTGESIYNVPNRVAQKSGLLQWKTNIIELTFQVQSKSATYTAKYFLGDNLFRLSPTLGKPLKLDSTNKEDIEFMIREANQYFEKTYFNNAIYYEFFNDTVFMEK